MPRPSEGESQPVPAGWTPPGPAPPVAMASKIRVECHTHGMTEATLMPWSDDLGFYYKCMECEVNDLRASEKALICKMGLLTFEKTVCLAQCKQLSDVIDRLSSTSASYEVNFRGVGNL